MQDTSTLSKQQLQQRLLSVEATLVKKETELATERQELLKAKDINRQLHEKLAEQQKAYLQLWRERFGRKSERYIADPDQLRIDFGDTDDSADAAAGLADAVEEADLIPAHKRRKRRKNSHALPAHFPRREEFIDAAESETTCPPHGEKQLLPESMWENS